MAGNLYERDIVRIPGTTTILQKVMLTVMAKFPKVFLINKIKLSYKSKIEELFTFFTLLMFLLNFASYEYKSK